MRLATLGFAIFTALYLALPSAMLAQEPLTLEEAVRTAVRNNPLLRAQEDAAGAAHARTGQVRAGWLPRIDFSQGFTRGTNPVYVFGTLLTQRQFTASNFALNQLNTPTPLDNFQTRLEGQVSLFDSGQTRLRVRGAKRLETAADLETEQARQDLVLRVVQAYYGVLVARENLAAAREALRTAQANVERVGNLEKAGLVVASDLLSAQVFRAQMEERAIRAENQLELSRMTLGRELGLGPQALREPAGALGEPPGAALSIEEYEKAALANRPALKAAELEQRAAEDNRKLTRAQFGPRIGLFADVERDAQTLGSRSGTNWTAGAKLEWNISAGGADRYRLAEAEARQRQAAEQLEWFRSGVRLEVRQAYLDVVAAQRRADAARASVSQAAESLRILQNRYEAGLASITDLLRAQTAQLEARTTHLAALHDWQVARAQLERAAGRLTPDSGVIHPAEAHECTR
jgi:outer membrane protein TolC